MALPIPIESAASVTSVATTATAATTNEQQYLNLLANVLKNGKERGDRTGTGTISLFSPPSLDLDISSSIPMVTTKRVPFRAVVHELLWFLRGVSVQ